MIQKVSWLCFDCDVEGCPESAVIEVQRTNDELPSNFVQWGRRSTCFCAGHIPNDVRAMWRGEERAAGSICRAKGI